MDQSNYNILPESIAEGLRFQGDNVVVPVLDAEGKPIEGCSIVLKKKKIKRRKKSREYYYSSDYQAEEYSRRTSRAGSVGLNELTALTDHPLHYMPSVATFYHDGTDKPPKVYQQPQRNYQQSPASQSQRDHAPQSQPQGSWPLSSQSQPIQASTDQSKLEYSSVNQSHPEYPIGGSNPNSQPYSSSASVGFAPTNPDLPGNQPPTHSFSAQTSTYSYSRQPATNVPTATSTENQQPLKDSNSKPPAKLKGKKRPNHPDSSPVSSPAPQPAAPSAYQVAEASPPPPEPTQPRHIVILHKKKDVSPHKDEIHQARIKCLQKKDWKLLDRHERLELMREKYPDKRVWQQAPPIIPRYSLQAEKVMREAYGLDKDCDEHRIKNMNWDEFKSDPSNIPVDNTRRYPKAKFIDQEAPVKQTCYVKVKKLPKDTPAQGRISFRVLLPEELAGVYVPDDGSSPRSPGNKGVEQFLPYPYIDVSGAKITTKPEHSASLSDNKPDRESDYVRIEKYAQKRNSGYKRSLGHEEQTLFGGVEQSNTTYQKLGTDVSPHQYDRIDSGMQDKDDNTRGRCSIDGEIELEFDYQDDTAEDAGKSCQAASSRHYPLEEKSEPPSEADASGGIWKDLEMVEPSQPKSATVPNVTIRQKEDSINSSLLKTSSLSEIQGDKTAADEETEDIIDSMISDIKRGMAGNPRAVSPKPEQIHVPPPAAQGSETENKSYKQADSTPAPSLADDKITVSINDSTAPNFANMERDDASVDWGGTILSEQEHTTTHQTFDVEVLIEEEETISKATEGNAAENTLTHQRSQNRDYAYEGQDNTTASNAGNNSVSKSMGNAKDAPVAHLDAFGGISSASNTSQRPSSPTQSKSVEETYGWPKASDDTTRKRSKSPRRRMSAESANQHPLENPLEKIAMSDNQAVSSGETTQRSDNLTIDGGSRSRSKSPRRSKSRDPASQQSLSSTPDQTHNAADDSSRPGTPNHLDKSQKPRSPDQSTSAVDSIPRPRSPDQLTSAADKSQRPSSPDQSTSAADKSQRPMSPDQFVSTENSTLRPKSPESFKSALSTNQPPQTPDHFESALSTNQPQPKPPDHFISAVDTSQRPKSPDQFVSAVDTSENQSPTERVVSPDAFKSMPNVRDRTRSPDSYKSSTENRASSPEAELMDDFPRAASPPRRPSMVREAEEDANDGEIPHSVEELIEQTGSGAE